MANIVTSKTRNLTGSKHSAQGKGTWTRSRAVSKKEFDENWERTFGKADKGKSKRQKNGPDGT